MKTKLLLLFILMFLHIIGTACATTNSEEVSGNIPLVVKKCQDFKVTGDGSADVWKSAKWIEIIKQGPDKSPYKTKAKVLYSETGIYFLFDCEDKKITASMKADNLDIYNEDVVEVFLWTDENTPLYFEYELSPLNYELPIIVPNNDGDFFGWLPWHYEGERRTQHATSVTGGKKESGAVIDGWRAEFFIPYKLLKPLNNVPPVSGTKWRANMYRIDYDDGTALFTWKEIEKSFHEYKKYGIFVFE
jgi:cellulose/xylan binding protein with CBM9 domain